jgi:hypothetical protein
VIVVQFYKLLGAFEKVWFVRCFLDGGKNYARNLLDWPPKVSYILPSQLINDVCSIYDI